MDLLWKLSELRNPILSELFQVVTLFGEEMLVILLLCLVYWCINKTLAYQE